MFKNYFKTAWRNLVKNRFYSLINIAGLTMGLAVGILILLWVQDELSFDKFHKNADNIYKLENRVGTGSSIQIWQSTVAPIGLMAKSELPQVKAAVRTTQNGNYSLFTYGDKTFKENNTLFADATIFSVFDFPLLKGNNAQPFKDDHSIIINETIAKKYFGADDPIGKVITAEDKTPFTVTAVMKDLPKNSSFQFEILFPFSLLKTTAFDGRGAGPGMDNDFHQFNYATYFLLQPGTDLKKLSAQIRNIHLRNKADDTDIDYLLQEINKVHLYHSDGSDAGFSSIRMFIIIALLILVIACINYVNLSTARAMLRAKEISLRKIIGAARIQLFMQFIVETALLFLLATILAIGAIYLLIPLFNQVSGKELVFDLSSYHMWKIIGCTIAGTLIASSIYPALLLSSFEPLKALKGKISARVSDVVFRRVLVVVQFTFSIVLIAGTFVIGNQLDYIRSKELGYDKEHVFAFFMRDMSSHYDAAKANLLKTPGISEVTKAGGNIIQMGGQTGNNSWDGKGANETFMVHPMSIDKDFIPFFNIKLVAGNNFTGAVADSTHFIMNETAIKTLGFKDPIGKRFRLWNTDGTIIGVVKDFHFASMKQKIEPAIFEYKPQKDGAIYIKTTGQGATAAIAAAEVEWKQYNAGYPFGYTFLDDSFNKLYQSEQRTGTLFNVFAMIAIIISCLGLFGLAAFTAQIRTREIGVRKVLGASVSTIISLLARDFIKLVLVAIVIAVPLAWYMMDKWLQDFAYKINIGWSVFLLSGAIAILIAIITISFQSIKAALANPVKSLRTE
jgi:putative ABC transport system permease protein